jgi:SAM-dependent MidA family methyltransferase
MKDDGNSVSMRPPGPTKPWAASGSRVDEVGRVNGAVLQHQIAHAIDEAGGWIGFDRFMEMALYSPGLGYYSRHGSQIGRMPQGGSDFVTAPEISPAFGATLAVQVAEALAATRTREVWEFGAGTGALAEQLLEALDALDAEEPGAATASGPVRYNIVDLSAGLAERQRHRLARFGDRVRWCSELPPYFEGVVVGNEVLDAMPVRLLARVGGEWHERGVTYVREADPAAGGASETTQATAPGTIRFLLADRPTSARPPTEIAGDHDYLTEIHPQAQAFIATLGDRLTRGAVLLIDYGFPAAEYYHPQRDGGTVMCHQAHRVDADPLVQVGHKDITAHVDFTAMALVAQDAGFDVLGYTSQGRFLLNCGLTDALGKLSIAEQGPAQLLVLESEMGELFKVLLLAKGADWSACGFVQGDRTHRL